MIKDKKISIIYKIIICLISLFSLLLNIGLFTQNYNIKGLTMFTNISNLLCFVYFLLDIIKLFTNYEDKVTVYYKIFKGIVTMNIAVTFLIALFVLKMYPAVDSLLNISFIGLHYIVPIMTVGDYLLFDRKGDIEWFHPFIWLIVPGIYLIVALITAQFGNGIGVTVTSKYPYPFLDINNLGYLKVFSTCILLTFIFLILGFIFFGIDRFLMEKIKDN